MLTERDIARIADRIVKRHAPLIVGVFGSYAIGTAGAASDLDIFVIQNAGAQTSCTPRSVRRTLNSVLHPLDIHVFAPDLFEAQAHEVLSFPWVIARQAKLYHAAEAANRQVPSLFA